MVRAKRTGEETTFTLKFAPEERELVGRLVDARVQELRDAAGIDIDLSIAAYIKWLIERDAQARGLSSPKRKKA